MAKVIAVANQKGGVGKTTTVVNLSSCIASLGKKVLVVDLDPQGNTTSGYGVAKHTLESGIYPCLLGEANVREAVVATKYNADLLPSNTELAGAGIDVFEQEPPLDTAHPLLHAKNTIVTPHVAFASAESMVARAKIVFDNIDAFLSGEQRNIVL